MHVLEPWRGPAGPRRRALSAYRASIAGVLSGSMVLFVSSACRPPASDDTTTTATTTTTGDASSSGTSEGEDTTTTGDAGDGTLMVHSFGLYEVKAHQETFPCVQWTPHLQRPLYVNTVLLANDGGSHHSNWFVVPEATFDGPDGYFDCEERGFDDYAGALNGAVLFAQSTQSRYEAQDLPDGVVIKIPPFYKVVSQIHMLNPGSLPLNTELRMGFEVIHPRDVEVIAAPFRLAYDDLWIPAHARSRHQAECDLAKDYEKVAGKPFDMRLFYVLPHYHYLGERFTLEIAGGPRDGEQIFELAGFNGDANGHVFEPPVELAGAQGLRFSCTYNNWTDEVKHNGNGDQEMCMMLGLADSAAMFNATVASGSEPVGVDGDIQVMTGPCGILAIPKPAAYQMPTEDEIAGPLYLPPVEPGDVDLPPVKSCVDADPSAAPAMEPTLSNLRDAIFTPSCTYSACHFQGPVGAAADLDLDGADLHTALLKHPTPPNAGMPLVTPGDPAKSWLYHLIAECEPHGAGGALAAHMPLGAPTLLPSDLVASVREWIVASALDN